MRRRTRDYRTLDTLTQERDATPWYWRIVAHGSAFLMLGGYLMLPITFDNDAKLRISVSVLGIFGVALLTAAFSFTALLCFAVRNPLYQAESVFLPALTSCVVGLLTILYDFLISSRYVWNTPALLLTITAIVSTITYAGLLIFVQRSISTARTRSNSMLLRPQSLQSGTSSTWQDSTFYENYNRNMFPTFSREPPPQQTGYDPSQITEEEMQRQQMLMLLLQKDQAPTPDPSQSTFRIDWQGQEDDGPPPGGYYAPQPQSAHTPASAYPQTAAPPQSGISRQWTGELQPWDGVWRGPPRSTVSSSIQRWDRAADRDSREERRRQIEQGVQ